MPTIIYRSLGLQDDTTEGEKSEHLCTQIPAGRGVIFILIVGLVVALQFACVRAVKFAPRFRSRCQLAMTENIFGWPSSAARFQLKDVLLYARCPQVRPLDSQHPERDGQSWRTIVCALIQTNASQSGSGVGCRWNLLIFLPANRKLLMSLSGLGGKKHRSSSNND